MPRMTLICLLCSIILGCDQTNPSTMQTTNGKSFLALGDSYTIGESVPKTERWPVQLAMQPRR